MRLINAKLKSKAIFISILSSVLFEVSSYSMALSSESMEVRELAKQLQQVTMEAKKLQEEVKTLKVEMQKLKKEAAIHKKHKAKKSETQTEAIEIARDELPVETKIDQPGTFFSRFARMPTVTTSPYIGLQSAYDGSDLVVDVSSMAEDLRLLRQRQTLAKKLGGGLSVFENRPVVIISGKLEPTVGTRRHTVTRHHSSDIDLDSSELDFLIEASQYAFGFMSVAYDNRSLDSSLVNSPIGRRISNSNIYLKRGFITLGNLDKSPFYLSAGQMYTDFGRYTSNLINGSLPSKIGKTNARQIHLGFATPMGISLSGYVFRGDSFTGRPVLVRNGNSFLFGGDAQSGRSNVINEGGFNVRYKKDFQKFGMELGTGYITNIADSETMQTTGIGGIRRGFAFTNEFLYNRVPAFNAYGEFKILNKWKFVTEYVGATAAFDIRNMSFNWKGAKPRATQFELSRKFVLLGKPSLIGIAYNHSWESYALGLPKDSYGAVFSVFPIKNVRFTLEYRYNKEYPFGTTGYINGGLAIPALNVIRGDQSKGGHFNSVIAQLGLYF